MYKYVLNLVIQISLMFAQYFEYYAIIRRGGAFFCGHSIVSSIIIFNNIIMIVSLVVRPQIGYLAIT